MATKTEHDLIEELLRKDEEELRAKKKRLRDFSGALDALRTATDLARETASAALEAGDLTRGELSSAFSLSRGERAVVLPTQSRSATESAETVGGGSDAANGPDHQTAQ